MFTHESANVEVSKHWT